MSDLKFWRLCAALNVRQAAYLLVGADPSEGGEPAGFLAAFTALQNAITTGKLKARIRHKTREYGWREKLDDQETADAHYWPRDQVRGFYLESDEKLSKDGEWVYMVDPDWELTLVNQTDIREWLASMGQTSDFFSGGGAPGDPEYLNPEHPRYSTKLAAAVKAWLAVTETRGKTPKQVVKNWLQENAAGLGLSELGEVNKQAVEECAKVANWQPRGGAPKTPG